MVVHIRKFCAMVSDGVVEATVTGWLLSGEDPHHLGPRKSLYKCAFQYVQRLVLVQAMIGEGAIDFDLPGMQVLQKMKHSGEKRPLRDLVVCLGREVAACCCFLTHFYFAMRSGGF